MLPSQINSVPYHPVSLCCGCTHMNLSQYKQFQGDKNRIANQVGSESIVSSVYNSSCFSFRYCLLAEEGLKEREHVQPLLCVPCSFLPGLFCPTLALRRPWYIWSSVYWVLQISTGLLRKKSLSQFFLYLHYTRDSE